MSGMTFEPEELIHRDQWTIAFIHTHDGSIRSVLVRTSDVNEE